MKYFQKNPHGVRADFEGSAAEPEAVFVAEGSEQNCEEVDEPAEAEEAEGAEVENPGADFANVETVDAKLAQEKTESQSNPAAFRGGHGIDAGAMGVVSVGVCIVDDNGGLLLGLGRLGLLRGLRGLILGLLGRLGQFCAAVRAKGCAGGDVCAAAGAPGDAQKLAAGGAIAGFFGDFRAAFGTLHMIYLSFLSSVSRLDTGDCFSFSARARRLAMIWPVIRMAITGKQASR